MNKKTFLFLLIFIVGTLFISLASAETPTYKQNQAIQLTAVCDNCTFVNLTSVTYPSGTFALLGQFSMTKNGTNYNYSFSDTSIPGIYNYVTCGDLNGVLTCEDTIDRSFEVTPSGITQKSVLQNPFLIILFFLSLICLSLGVYFKIPSIGFIGGLLLTLTGVYVMIYGFNDTTNLYTRGVAGTFIGLGILFIAVSAYEWVLKFGDGDEEE